MANFNAREPASLDLLATEVRQQFQQQYAKPPQWLAVAPGRVNLMGDHVDYNNGLVLPMAIERYTLVAAAPRPTTAGEPPQFCLQSSAAEDSQQFSVTDGEVPMISDWTAYVRGIVAGFLKRGASLPSLDLTIHSNVPLGGGLSSSAALEVATATLFEAVTETPLPPLEKICLCQKAEHEYVGVPCGIMDQFIASTAQSGELLLLDCRTLQAEGVPFDTEQVAVLVINSNVQHGLVDGEYAARRRECVAAAAELGIASLRDATLEQLAATEQLGPLHRRRARHVIREIERARQTAAALRRCDWPTAGQLMVASHDSLRDDYEVSCPELDQLVQIACHIGTDGGVFGSRMTGGGFGGSTVSLVRADAVDTVADTIITRYEQATGITPTTFIARPTRGAHQIALC